MMNEKTVKKIGEAYAFSQNLNSLYTNYQEILKSLLGEHSDNIIKTTEFHVEELQGIVEKEGITDILLAKVEKTDAKIQRMADMYVGDQWDNPVEVLEWMSFFFGAAIVHWQLILGSAQELGNQDLEKTAFRGVASYEKLFEHIRGVAQTVGKERAAG